MAFRDFPKKAWIELLPNASEAARDLVNSLVRYESAERLSAQEVSGSGDICKCMLMNAIHRH